ncbi:hypothetical protein GQX74_010737 [Glossina fuscipes]|nr:hypothetical protein GQX74_010737 [Glossina fuscipes]
MTNEAACITSRWSMHIDNVNDANKWPNWVEFLARSKKILSLHTKCYAAAIPLLLARKDVSVEAVTGRRPNESPWTPKEISAIITSPTRELALQISELVFRQLTSRVTLNSPHLVISECNDGCLFSYLLNEWRFSSGLKDIPQSCVLNFRVAFEPESLLHIKFLI